MNTKKVVLGVFALLMSCLLFYLLRPLSTIPAPAEFTCLAIEDGIFRSVDSLPQPQNIYGMGLTYRQHLLETAAEFDPTSPPPIFRKKRQSLNTSGEPVSIPSTEQMRLAAEDLEEGVGQKLGTDFDNLSALLDYEVELGFILLEDITSGQLSGDHFVPPLGYFIANDLSARSIALLGEGTDMRYEYWGVSKSFPGFLPMSDQIWIPNKPSSNSIPCVKIETYVNGEFRQGQTTDNMIYTPLQMLRFVQEKYPETPLKKGDVVLTGTPGGVAIATPRALVRLSNLLGFDRYRKLSIKLKGDQSSFLKGGDVVEVKGAGLGSVRTNLSLE